MPETTLERFRSDRRWRSWIGLFRAKACVIPGKQFYRYALEYGLTEDDFNGKHDPERLDDSHPYIHVDMSQCVTCYRCVRICEEVRGQFVWQVLNRVGELETDCYVPLELKKRLRIVRQRPLG